VFKGDNAAGVEVLMLALQVTQRTQRVFDVYSAEKRGGRSGFAVAHDWVKGLVLGGLVFVLAAGPGY
jgi:hypothetical protein